MPPVSSTSAPTGSRRVTFLWPTSVAAVSTTAFPGIVALPYHPNCYDGVAWASTLAHVLLLTARARVLAHATRSCLSPAHQPTSGGSCGDGAWALRASFRRA